MHRLHTPTSPLALGLWLGFASALETQGVLCRLSVALPG